MITNITKFYNRWSFSMGDRGHMKLSSIGKSPIRRTYLFDITVVAIINIIYLIMETVPKKVLPLILWSFTFTTEMGSYIWPKLKNRIPSTCVRIFTSFILILLHSSYVKNRISPSWKISLIFM